MKCLVICSVTARQSDALGDKVAHHFVGDRAERTEPGVAEKSLKRRLLDNAVAAQDAQATVGGTHRGFACRKLRHRGLDRTVAAERLQPGGFGGYQAYLLKLGSDVAKRMLHRLEGPDRATKGVPVARVLQRLVERRRSDSDIHRRAQNALFVE